MGRGRPQNVTQAVLLIGTPQLREAVQHPTAHDSLKFEVATALDRAGSGAVKLLPLLQRGSYKGSFPEPVLRHFVRPVTLIV